MNDHRLSRFNGSFYICGFMGTGKSVLGSLLAERLDLEFMDLDAYIVEKEGQEITAIFENSGEAYFREKEWECLLELSRSFKGVVSLGGGSLQNQQIVDHLKVNGLLILIDTPLDIVVDRILQNKQRPIVLDEQGEIKSKEVLFAELKMLYSERFEFYNQAEIKFLSSGYETKENQVNLLIDKIKKHV